MKLHWPLPATNTKITTQYLEWLKNNSGDWYQHVGIDISADIGTPVYAAHAGMVLYEHTNAGGNVQKLIGDECYTRYAHLHSYTADDGELVQAGSEIARSGNTGSLTTGAHLHFELHDLGGNLIAPLSVMEVPMVGKLCLHIQNRRDWLTAVVDKYWNYHTQEHAWVKVINPDTPDIFPNTHILGRAFWHSDNDAWEKDCIKRGAAGAAEYFNYLLPHYQGLGNIVTAWEGPNEPDLTTIQAAYAYSDFMFAWIAKMHNAGLKVCGGSIAVGNPKLKAFNGSNQELKIIAPVLSQCDYWSYHAYWDGLLSAVDNWWAFRYRLIVSECKELGITLPPLIISESGCDKGGGYYDGWRARMNWNEHLTDVKLFGAELQKDSYVEAAALFDVAPDSKWPNFEYDEQQCRIIGEYRLGLEEEVTEPVNIEQIIGDEAQKYILPLNPDAALEKAAAKLGALTASKEFDILVAGTSYRAMAARRPDNRDIQIILYCINGDWGNVKSFERAN